MQNAYQSYTMRLKIKQFFSTKLVDFKIKQKKTIIIETWSERFPSFYMSQIYFHLPKQQHRPGLHSFAYVFRTSGIGCAIYGRSKLEFLWNEFESVWDIFNVRLLMFWMDAAYQLS